MRELGRPAILDALQGTLPPPPPSISRARAAVAYRLIVVVLALATLALLVAVTGFAVARVVNHVGTPNAEVGELLGRLVWPVVIIVVVLHRTFAVKHPKRRAILRESEPFLYELVDRVCAMTGCPRVDEIHLTSGHDGLAAGIQGRSVLWIGLPVMARLDQRQFICSLAMTAALGARAAATPLWVERVAHWWRRVVLPSQPAQPRGFLTTVVTASAAALTLLAFIPVLVPAFVLLLPVFRSRLELIADHYGVAVAGSATWHEALRAMVELELAYEVAMTRIGEAGESGLPEDFVEYLERVRSGLPHQEVEDRLAETAAFTPEDGQSSYATRVERARQQNGAGVLPPGPTPSSRTFLRGFDEYAREITSYQKDDILQAARTIAAFTQRTIR